MARIVVRGARRGDVGAAADLIVRSKRLNNEFDPLFMVSGESQPRAERYLRESLGSKGVLVMVAVRGAKVVGVLRAEVRDRVFYRPAKNGYITDFYIMPEFRRKALGNVILEKAAGRLCRMGAEMITAEVPTQNQIAVKFYTKRGFRSLIQIFAARSQ